MADRGVRGGVVVVVGEKGASVSSVVKRVTVACKYELLAKHAISVCVCVYV